MFSDFRVYFPHFWFVGKREELDVAFGFQVEVGLCEVFLVLFVEILNCLYLAGGSNVVGESLLKSVLGLVLDLAEFHL